MHQSPPNSIRAPSRRATAPRRAAAVLALGAVLCVGGLQLLLRGEPLRGRVEAALDSVAVDLNARITVGAIRPAGMWGIELVDLELRPHRVAPAAGDPRLVRIPRVVVYPALRELLAGRLALTRVVVEQPEISARVDPRGGSHADWISWLTHSVRRDAGAGGAGSGHDGVPTPVVEIIGGTAALDDPSGRIPSLGVRFESLTLDLHDPTWPIAGRVLIEGVGRGALSGSLAGSHTQLSLELLDDADLLPLLPAELPVRADARVQIGGVHVDWPPRLTFDDVRASRLSAAIPGLDGRPLEAFGADSLELVLRDAGVFANAVGVDLVFGGDALASLPIERVGVERAWATGATSAAIDLLDRDGNPAAVVIEHDPSTGRTAARATATAFDPAALVAVVGPVHGVTVGGRFSGSVGVGWAARSSHLDVDVDASAIDLSVNAPLLDSAPIDAMAAEVVARLSVDARTDLISLERTRIYLPEVGLFLVAEGLRDPARTVLDLHATLPRRDANALAASLPGAIGEAFDGFVFAGPLGFDGRVHIDSADPEQTVASLTLDADEFSVVQFGPRAPIDRLE
ncbi:MAG: hypothetical protein H6700_12910, partial [Myxococcales bacterium]|nr:hypothetical protein [Myxococcales bacterium]